MTQPAIYFSSIELTNIKTFDSQVLEFKNASGKLSQWNLLLGDNGVGKTTILQCLVEMCADPSDPVYFEKKKDAYYTPQIFQQIKNPDGFTAYSRSETKLSSIKVFFAKNTKLGEKLKSPSVNSHPTEVEFENGGPSSTTLINSEFASLQPFGYGAFRRFGSTKLGAELNPNSCSTLFEDNEPLINVEEWLLRSDYAVTKSRDVRAQKRLNQIKDLLTKFLPEVESIRIRASGSEIPTPEAKTPDGWIPVKFLSTGYRATMAWVTDFAARMLDRYPDSINPFAEPAVVLVDQIDTHLHPKWQRQLIEDLSNSFPATQFIVTAHSPLMVLAMPEANIAVLHRENGFVRIDNNPDDVRGWRLDQIIASGLFEEQPTRDPVTEGILEERRKLLTKSHLTKKEQARVSYLNDLAATIPTSEAPDDIRALDIIRRASEKLNSES